MKELHKINIYPTETGPKQLYTSPNKLLLLKAEVFFINPEISA